MFLWISWGFFFTLWHYHYPFSKMHIKTRRWKRSQVIGTLKPWMLVVTRYKHKPCKYFLFFHCKKSSFCLNWAEQISCPLWPVCLCAWESFDWQHFLSLVTFHHCSKQKFHSFFFSNTGNMFCLTWDLLGCLVGCWCGVCSLSPLMVALVLNLGLPVW